jgi:hypothetical protein
MTDDVLEATPEIEISTPELTSEMLDERDRPYPAELDDHEVWSYGGGLA